MKKRILFIILLIGSLGIITIHAQDEETLSKEQKEKMEQQKFEMQEALEQAKEVQVRWRDAGRSLPSAYSIGDGFYFEYGNGGSSSQLSLSKYFDGESKKSTGTFNVEDDVRQISINLSGAVKSGKIVIKVQLGNEDVIKDLTIDDSADIQFNQTINIAKDEKKYYGDWKYTVDAQEATGKYRISIQTH